MKHCLRLFCFWLLLSSMASYASAKPSESPNIILILTDDMGAGDWQGADNRFIKTPNLLRLANSGITLTDFHASANVCTPSRAGLLTGRYPARSGLAKGVIYPHSDYGLPSSEITIAEFLKDTGYQTIAIGKWHLGTVPGSKPLDQGFQQFFGVPYSNDMQPFPLLDDERIVEETADQTRLTDRYTQRALSFIESSVESDQPFFIYLAHTFPHVPLYASDQFKGRSAAGRYGDTIEEIDHSVGRILDAVDKHNITDNTLIIFTSDNGPWFEGSSGTHRGRKGGTYDGGYRVPFIARMPGLTASGKQSSALTSNMDILPTVLKLVGAQPPAKHKLDGKDITSVLAGSKTSPHAHLLFFENEHIAAIRTQQWRFVVQAYYKSFLVPFERFGSSLLFNLERHQTELYNLIEDEPEELIAMQQRLQAAREEFGAIPQKFTPPVLPEPLPQK